MFPKLLDLGPLPIHTYGLLLALALLLSIELLARLAGREGIDRNRIWDLGFVIILSALIGAKVLLVLTDWRYYWSAPSRLFSFEFLQAGGVYYGGLLGAVFGTSFYLRRHRELGFWRISDLAAPCIAFGQALGRLGCFAAGCDYGRPTDLPWAVTFRSEYAHNHVGVPLGVQLHPTQLYESAAALAIFVLLLLFYRKRTFRGQVFLLYLLLYSVTRLGLELFRGDESRGLYFDGMISTSQIISLIVIPVAATLYFKRRRKRRGAA